MNEFVQVRTSANFSSRDFPAGEAGDSIKSRTPAELLGWGPRPGVERSGTPGCKSID